MRDTGRVTSNRRDTGRLTSNRRELGTTDKGQVRGTQNITSRFLTVVLSSLMVYFSLSYSGATISTCPFSSKPRVVVHTWLFTHGCLPCTIINFCVICPVDLSNIYSRWNFGWWSFWFVIHYIISGHNLDLLQISSVKCFKVQSAQIYQKNCWCQRGSDDCCGLGPCCCNVDVDLDNDIGKRADYRRGEVLSGRKAWTHSS